MSQQFTLSELHELYIIISVDMRIAERAGLVDVTQHKALLEKIDKIRLEMYQDQETGVKK